MLLNIGRTLPLQSGASQLRWLAPVLSLLYKSGFQPTDYCISHSICAVLTCFCYVATCFIILRVPMISMNLLNMLLWYFNMFLWYFNVLCDILTCFWYFYMFMWYFIVFLWSFNMFMWYFNMSLSYFVSIAESNHHVTSMLRQHTFLSNLMEMPDVRRIQKQQQCNSPLHLKSLHIFTFIWRL